MGEQGPPGIAGEFEVYSSPEANSLSNPIVFLGNHNLCVLTRIAIEKFADPVLTEQYAGTRMCEIIQAVARPELPLTGEEQTLVEEQEVPGSEQEKRPLWQLNAFSSNPDILVKCQAYCF